MRALLVRFKIKSGPPCRSRRLSRRWLDDLIHLWRLRDEPEDNDPTMQEDGF